MQEIIQWLISIEKMAGKFYGDAALFFRKDKALSRVLTEMAAEEAWHAQLMQNAAQTLKVKKTYIHSGVQLDQDLINTVEKTFLKNNGRLLAGTLNSNDIIKCMIDAEFSEWNDLFLYVL